MLFCSTYAFAQNDSIAEQERIASETYRARKVRFMADMRVMYIMPDAKGNNFLAKGSEGNHGLGLKFGIFKAYNFYFGIGGEFLFYETTDVAYGGNTSSTYINSGYLEAMYKISLARLDISPKASVGYSSIIYNADWERGEQDGFRLGVGAYADYNFTKWFALFIGADYTVTYPRVETNAAYQDFFGKVEQLNFSAGVKFTLKD